MWGNAGFANQECKEVSYITEDGYKRYKTVCGATLLCDSKVEKYGIKFFFDFKNGTMIESRKDRNDWETNIVGSINSEIFTYGIYVGSGDMYSHIFYVMTSNLDNHFDIITKKGTIFDFKEILSTLQKIDRNISSFDEYLTVPYKNKRNEEKEKEKFDAIVEFMTTLKGQNTENLKCHGI